MQADRVALFDRKFIRQQWRMWIETAAWANCPVATAEFIRQQWRMWIETLVTFGQSAYRQEFIRQQWRMWIETFGGQLCRSPTMNSFASNGECGLKHGFYHVRRFVSTNSFASNGECGLKQCQVLPPVLRLAQFIRQQWRMWIETV